MGVRTGRVGQSVPTEREIAAGLADCGQHHLTLRKDGRALRRASALALDLSGIAKGFGADELARVALGNGIGDFVAEIDGEMRVAGTRPDGSAWRVAIALPVPHLRAAYAGLELGTMAVATSGDYRHFFETGGRHYSHQIDGKTGAPVAQGLASVTVFHAGSCARADALASALMVMGWDAGRDWCAAHNVSAVLLRRNGGEIDRLDVGPILALPTAGATNPAPGREARPD
ncbi:MAG: FAD:protein FMN transferase [Devosia sp.]